MLPELGGLTVGFPEFPPQAHGLVGQSEDIALAPPLHCAINLVGRVDHIAVRQPKTLDQPAFLAG